MKFEIFEGDTLQEAVDKALTWCEKNKGHIATLKEVYDLKKNNKIPEVKGYDLATIYIEGEVRTATVKELKNLKELYSKGGRVLFLYNHYDGLLGDSNLNNYGRFVAISKC